MQDIVSVLNRRLFKTASFRLSALYGTVFAACFAALLFVTYWTTTTALRDQMRMEIADRIEAISSEAAADGTATIVLDINERTNSASKSIGYYYLSDGKGLKLAGNLDGIVAKDGWQEIALGEGPTVNSTWSPDEDHQLWAQGIHLADGSFLLVGQDAYRVLAAQEAIINSFAWSAGIAFLLTAIAGIGLSQGFLRRIDNINMTSLAIIDGHLKERIPVHGTSDEIDRLSTNLNRLFDSNQALLQSLKQVSSNIAHDLRTPLTRLRQGIETALTKSGTKKSYEDAMHSALEESDQLLATFAALLRISQIESGSRKTGFKILSLSDLFDRVINAYRAVIEDDDKQLKTLVDPELNYYGDGELLLQMVANLVENAIRHTPAQTEICIHLEKTAQGAIAYISDSGPGIPIEQRDKVFEHFYRLDASRTTPGNGLGLALVAAVCNLHGIKILVDDNKPGLKVVLQFLPQPSY